MLKHLAFAAALTLSFTATACATVGPRPSRPNIPAQISDQAAADELYAKNKLECDGGKCSRSDGAFDFSSASVLSQGYGPPTHVIDNDNFYRTGVLGAAGAFLLAGALYGGLLHMSASDMERANEIYPIHTRKEIESVREGGWIALGTGAGLGAVSALIYALWPSNEDEFEAAYNASLRDDINRRVRAR